MKKGISVGFTIQVDQYEPVKISAWEEVEGEGSVLETGEDIDIEITKKVVKRIDKVADECVKKVSAIKTRILDELSD